MIIITDNWDNENIEKEMPCNFRDAFPLVCEKLNSLQKRIHFLDCSRFARVIPEVLAEIAEYVLKEAQRQGRKKVRLDEIPYHFQQGDISEFKRAVGMLTGSYDERETLTKILFSGLGLRSITGGIHTEFDFKK